MRKQRQAKPDTGTLRIIGGTHRGRKLQFPVLPGVRPTPDRVRETLFNWLAADIPGARCLDLFAGSGALGLEAISRDAGTVTFVDSSDAITRSLAAQLSVLKAENQQVIRSDALAWLKTVTSSAPFDIVFLDPPFNQHLLEPIISELSAGNHLKAGSRIYIEAESSLAHLPVPPTWQADRHKQAGQVQYALFTAT